METLWIVIIVIAVIVLLLGVFAGMQMRRRQLRKRFGPEYDRVVAEQDGRGAAEKELRERERRHAELELRPLSGEARDRYLTEWEEIQARFLDAPDEAVRAGDDLLDRVVSERGYPANDFNERVADLSVDYGYTVGHYREARELAELNSRGEASTEQLRQALVHYRAIFAELVGERSLTDDRTGNRTHDERAVTASRDGDVAEPSHDGDRHASHEDDRRRDEADATPDEAESTVARSGGRPENNKR